MKYILTLIIFLSVFTLKCQYPYRAITVKTNLLSLWNISLEVPVYKRITTELSYRAINFVDFDIAFLDNHQKQTLRWNVKYHFPREDNTGRYYSGYVFTGLDQMKHTVDYGSNERGILDVTRLAIGVGTKRRRIDLWIACEKIIDTRQNEYFEGSVGNNAIPHRWFPDISVSGGIAFNLFNIKL